MRNIIIDNSYFEYVMHVTPEGHLCHDYFLPKNATSKPKRQQLNKIYPYEVAIAVDYEGRTDTNVGNRQLYYKTSHNLKFQDYFVVGNQHIVQLFNEEKFMEVQLVYEAYPESPALHRYTRIVNQGEKRVTLNHVSSFVLGNFPYFGKWQDLALHTYSSAWSYEGEEHIYKFEELDLCEYSRTGYTIENDSAYTTIRNFPNIIIEEKEASIFWGAQLESNGQWRMEVGAGDIENPKWFYMQGGMIDLANSQWYKNLEPGQSYETPKVSLTVATGKIDEVYNQFHAHQKKVLMHRSESDMHLPVVFNDWQALKGDTSEKQIVSQLDILQDFGVEAYVTDDGWFTEPGQKGYEYVGCWDYSRTRFPNGLTPVCKAITERGMIPGIWCEIEMAGLHSPVYRESDMFLQINGTYLTQGERCFLDFSKEKVCTYATDIFKRLYESGFRYIKVDYNADCTPGCDGSDSLKENLNQKRLAYSNWIEGIQKKYPDLIIEHCASGGLKLDYYNLARASIASITDQESYLYTGPILYNLSKLVHPVQCGNWSRIASDFDRKTTEFVLTNSMMGRMCLSGVFSECTEDVKAAIREAISFYKKYRFVIEEPSIYYHTPPAFITDKEALRIMEYQTQDEEYSLIYINTHGFVGKYTFTPHQTGMRVVDCYPDINGIIQTDDSVTVQIQQPELFGKILVLARENDNA